MGGIICLVSPEHVIYIIIFFSNLSDILIQIVLYIDK